jgi:hypothetical protein
VYKVTKAQNDTAQDYVESLLAKIASLEEENARLKENKTLEERDVMTRLLSRLNKSAGNHTTPSFRPPGIPTKLAVNKRASNIDGTGARARPGHPNPATNDYFGYSSTSTLMEQVMKSIGESGASNESDHPSSALTFMPVGVDNAIYEADYAGPENFALFPRPVTDYLLTRYWDKVYTLYPFVHKPTFMKSYERLWDANAGAAPANAALGLGESGSAGPLSFVFHCGLNAMLILGLEFTSIPKSEKDSLTFQCLQKCKNLLKFDLFNEGSVAVLQTTLLLAHYFQSTNSPNKGWVITGVSCRIAQGLGLHVDSPGISQSPPVVRELLRRLWYSTIIFDMMTAMTLGRPVMLRRHHPVPLPAPTDDEYLLHNIQQPENHFSGLTFFHETNKIYRVLRQALASVYKDNTDENGQKVDKTVALDEMVAKARSEIPDALDWDKPIADGLRINRATLDQQRAVLHLRFTAARVGLHRPLFIDYCRAKHQAKANDGPTARPNLAEKCQRSAAVVCIQESFGFAEVMDRYAGTEASCEWWHTMFFIRMASAIFMIAKTQPDLLEEVGSMNVEVGWQTCRDVLSKKLPQNDMVMDCLVSLDKMYKQVHAYASAQLQVDGNAVGMAASFEDVDVSALFEHPGDGFNFLDSGLLNLNTNEWGYGFDDFAGSSM